jgi:hypothetical protein
MTYVPDWERLAETLDRVMVATGLTSQEVQHDICRAIADRKIEVRPREAEPVTRSILDHQFNRRFASEYQGFVRRLLDGTIDMPWRVTPSTLDWSESRFLLTFQPGQEGYPGGPRDWYVWIELSSADVTAVLCKSPTSSNVSAPVASLRSGAKSRGIDDAIDYLWPEGSIPNGLSAKDRNRAILNRLKETGGSIPTDPARAIQRALKKRQLK